MRVYVRDQGSRGGDIIGEMRGIGLAVLWGQIRSDESLCGGVVVKRGGIKDGG